MKKLDDMPATELMNFWAKYHYGGYKAARNLLPAMPKGHVRATRNLANYASNLATFKTCGLSIYKEIAESIYQKLPAGAKELIR